MVKGKTVIIGVTASIAAYKACDIVRRLRERGINTIVLMTEQAAELVSPVTLQTLTGNKVYMKMFADSEAWEVEHISLAEKADLILIAPATANIVGKIAGGICDDLLTCVVCASSAPVLIAPAMNTNMFKNKIVQGNLKKLKLSGYKFVGPVEGKLACGEKGIGCLASVEKIVEEAVKLL